MPNWCNNSVTISGPTETIKQLWDDAQTAHEYTITNEETGEKETKREFGLLNAIAPIGDWEYDTAVNAWGTKWDISDEGLEFIDNGDGTAEIAGWFDSAWAPPITAYEKFCDDMDNCDITASYFEPGMDFAGFWSTTDGDEFCEDLHGEWQKPEDERSDLFKRLDEEYDLSTQFEEWDEM